MSALREDIRRLVAEACAIDEGAVRDDGSLMAYGLDSVRAMDLIITIEETFEVEVADADAAGLRTVDDLVRYVEAQVG